jgi:hypothetical protein
MTSRNRLESMSCERFDRSISDWHNSSTNELIEMLFGEIESL